MQDRIDQLIRNARPQVDPAARERVRAAATGGDAASRPGSLIFLLRAAALVLLAVGAGAAASVWSRPAGDDLGDAAARVASLERRVADDPAREIEHLHSRLDRLALALHVERTVDDALERAEIERWRDRHVHFARERWRRHSSSVISELREEAALTDAQESEVRALLASQGEKVEELIAQTYRPGRHALHQGFAQLSEETDDRLAELLEEQRREGIEVPRGVLDADPQDWAPSEDFVVASDFDAWVYWINQTTTQE